MIVSYSGIIYGGNINDLHNILQNLHPYYLQWKIGFKELPFLDILIKNENGEIITDINHKPTDTQQYLHFNSHHPQNFFQIWVTTH